jgi:hypothetical protein
MAWCDALAAAADAFASSGSGSSSGGSAADGLRAALASTYAPIFEGCHRARMDQLRALLAAEKWAAGAGNTACVAPPDALLEYFVYTPSVCKRGIHVS